MGLCFYTAYGGVICSYIPSQIISVEGEELKDRMFAPYPVGSSVTVINNTENGIKFASESECVIKLCGILPLKTVPLKTVPAMSVVTGGNVIGINLFTEGVLVISTDSFGGSDGRQHSPALNSGIKPGDVIVSVDDNPVTSSEELKKLVNNGKKRIKLVVIRDEKKQEIFSEPEYDTLSGSNKLGLWVRDSAAGIGTLTFYRKDNNKYAALGHGLSDANTGNIYKISGGEITNASVLSIEKGQKGAPGELKGILPADTKPLGNIAVNSSNGISGTLFQNNFISGDMCRIAPRSEVKCGEAYILSCIDGNSVERFSIEIQRTVTSGDGASKDMLLHVTDKKLIERTGGIVQGMSGSPIIQNGKLIGAVTHVLINDPTRGFGIFIDKMFDETN